METLQWGGSLWVAGFGAAVLSLSMGCGGGSDSASEPSSATEPLSATERLADSSFAELSAEDSTEVCEEFVEQAQQVFAIERLERFGCEVPATVQSPNPAACEDAVQTCLERGASGTLDAMDAAELEEISAELDAADCDGGLVEPGCEATVGEVSACYGDLFAAFDNLLSVVSCSDAGDSDLAERLQGFMPPTTPESCERLNEQCGAMISF